MGAWVVLTLAQRLSITDIHVIGDSKIIIDWLNNIGSLQVITIECWKDRVRGPHQILLCHHIRPCLQRRKSGS
jgi:hypothetical protein